MEKNQLYYGDNLTVLREHLKDESVDLIYRDPPFNSRQDYNVLFAERDGTRSASQIMAFEDTWEWNMDAERAYEEIVERRGRVSDAQLLEGRRVEYPRLLDVTFKKARKQGKQSRSKSHWARRRRMKGRFEICAVLSFRTQPLVIPNRLQP